MREERFAYSALPGRWGTPIAGAAAAAVLAGAGALGASGRGAAALGLLAGAGGAMALAGRWMARHGVLRAPLLRRTGVNLVAERGGDGNTPRVWLVAHVDSKSQPVPIGLRAAGVAGTGVAWLAAMGVAGAQALGAPLSGWWGPLAAVGVLAAMPVALTTVGGRSDGALDNASGVAAVLEAARRVPAHLPLGVLVTSAEELGLAGARAWALGRRPGVALNCDGVDDEGELVAMYSGRRPRALLDALDAAAAAAGTAVRARRLVPGILTDGVALADAGWPVVTVSRGTRATLRRIHTRHDDLAHLAGVGLAPAAALLAATASRLAADDGTTNLGG